MHNKTLLKLAISSIAIFALIGCGGSGDGSTNNNNGSNNAPTNANDDPYKTVPVTYKLNGNNTPLCPGAYDVTVLKAQTADDFGVTQCLWLCGEYEGAKPITVQLQFIQDGKDAVWTFDEDVVETAPRQCHN